MGRLMKQAVVLAGLLVAAASPAWAVTLLDFGIIAPTTGSISYSSSGDGLNPLIGTDISVDNVIGIGTPLNDFSVLTISGGELNFDTGDFTGSDADEWFFGAGGTITLTGGIDLDGGGIGAGDIPLDSVLLSGFWTGTPSVEQETIISKNFGAAFFDVKNDLLAGYYGLPGGSGWSGSINLSFITTSGNTPGQGFTSALVGSGDIFNFPPPAIPEPSSMLLMGLGLLGGLTGRKRFFS